MPGAVAGERGAVWTHRRVRGAAPLVDSVGDKLVSLSGDCLRCPVRLLIEPASESGDVGIDLCQAGWLAGGRALKWVVVMSRGRRGRARTR
jgi:hypothetical protein